MESGDRHENRITGDVSGTSVQVGAVHGDVFLQQEVKPVVPRQLLPVSSSFTDRERELTTLTRLLDDDQRQGPALAVITGSGGMGKTALASRWITKHIDRFPDGQLYVNLGAFSADEPTTPDDVLGGFLRALGVPAGQVPAEIAEQAAMYRSVTAGKKFAVLADDADSAAQVRPLLPASPDSVVVVTSRWRLGALAMDGARVLVVDPLDEAAGLRLLERTVGTHRVTTEPERARELVALCGGMPIALCVAAARLSTRPQWPISHLVGALSDERRRLEALSIADEASVQASFDLSFEELDAETARVYRLLGLHPGREFGAGLAAAAIDRTATETENALDSLVVSSLLTDIGPDRFQFHDLARVHARQQAARTEEPSARAGALRRMLNWYLDNVAEADLVIIPHRHRLSPRRDRPREQASRFSGTRDALDWVEGELANVVAAMHAAVDEGWWQEVWQFCEGLWGFFLYRKHYRQWEKTHKWAVTAARRCADPAVEARMHIQLGYAYLNTEKFEEARRQFTASLEVSRTIEDPAGEATAWEHLGIVAQSTGDHRHALEHFTRALRLAEKSGQRRGVVLQLRRIGEANAALGRTQEAIDHLERSAAEALTIGDVVLHARAQTRLGDAHLTLGRPGEASRLLEEAVTTLNRAGADPYHAEALEVLAESRLREGETHAARTHLRQALKIYRASRDLKAHRVEARIAAIADGTENPSAASPE
ncbi:tetratricopeptide repeat protein [Amycolatopsis sp. NPDC058340]|uniref:tetratricopeptide repeat protein n=1 Tax=Amycolatopsis sp. NPDC058340 TaxID=3346453 RepID=UPI0036489AEA